MSEWIWKWLKWDDCLFKTLIGNLPFRVSNLYACAHKQFTRRGQVKLLSLFRGGICNSTYFGGDWRWALIYQSKKSNRPTNNVKKLISDVKENHYTRLQYIKASLLFKVLQYFVIKESLLCKMTSSKSPDFTSPSFWGRPIF